MYTSSIDDNDYAIKPMNCPGGMLIYGRKPHSYRDLPLRAAEVGLVHRHELSGVLQGLFRVRAFHQDDAHLYMMPEQIGDEILGVLRLSERMYSTFGLGFHLELSTRPDKSIGTDEQWEHATKGLESGLNLHIKDALGRTWQCGTIQLDMALPERFNLTYIGKDNERHRPLMIHRTVFGSIERFLGILIEHFAGKLPLWLSPVQAEILPINDDLITYANEVKFVLEKADLRVEVDDRAESLNKKIREAQLNQIPLILTVGGKEKESGTLAVRTLDGHVKYGVPHEQFLNTVGEHIRNRELAPDLFKG
jgi:threonyl-tRNA synthetase